MDEAMYECIEKYLISADDNSDVGQYFIPNPLISPAVYAIGSG